MVCLEKLFELRMIVNNLLTIYLTISNKNVKSVFRINVITIQKYQIKVTYKRLSDFEIKIEVI